MKIIRMTTRYLFIIIIGILSLFALNYSINNVDVNNITTIKASGEISKSTAISELEHDNHELEHSYSYSYKI